jgi:hypothetical protein
MLQVFPQVVPPPLLTLALHHVQDVMKQSPPDEVIGREGKQSSNDPYMERWYLLRRNLQSNIYNVYLHRFVREDPEDLHDHPWANVSVVLHGSYVEHSHSLDGRRIDTRKAGDIVMRAAEDRHAIISVEPGTVTLFATGPKVREWGFWMNEVFVPWREYRALKDRQEAA